MRNKEREGETKGRKISRGDVKKGEMRRGEKRNVESE